MNSAVLQLLQFWLVFSLKYLNHGAAFTIAPSSQEVEIGEQATFRCQHVTAYVILWRLDDILVGSSLPSGVSRSVSSDETGNVFILTVSGSREYNRSVIECVAGFLNGSSEVSHPAYLTVINASPVHPQTLISESVTTLSVPGFAVFPLPMIVAIGETSTFHCSHFAADNIGWRVGNTSLGSKGLPGVTTSGNSLPSGGIAQTLVVNATHDLNGSVIQCIAFIDGSEPQVTSPVTLSVQGILGPVGALMIQPMSNTSIITWNHPFSLNLSNTEPDIIYCVDVFNITCGRWDHLISDCSVFDLMYTFTSTIDNSRYIYAITLTPKSNVESARNGTSLVLQEEFSLLKELSPTYSIAYTDDGVATVKLFLCLDDSVGNQTSIQPSNYISVLVSDDSLEESQLVVPATLIKEETVFVFQLIHPIPFRRLWRITLFAYGCVSNPVTTSINLSTHDFQNLSSYSHDTGKIVLSGYFINGSVGAGVLFILFSPHHDDNVLYINVLRIENQSRIQITVNGLIRTVYNISVYVLKESGLPFKRTSVKPRSVSIEASHLMGVDHENAIEYELHPTLTGVCITCTFLDNSTTDCVAVVHHRISQLSSSGLTNIESSHKFNRSGDTAYGCVEGVNLTHFQVGVIGGRMDHTQLITDKSSSWCALQCYVVICITGILLVFIGVMTSGMFYIIKHKATKTQQSHEQDQVTEVTLKENEAYEVIFMARQRLKLDTNPAYEEVRPPNTA